MSNDWANYFLGVGDPTWWYEEKPEPIEVFSGPGMYEVIIDGVREIYLEENEQ